MRARNCTDSLMLSSMINSEGAAAAAPYLKAPHTGAPDGVWKEGHSGHCSSKQQQHTARITHHVVNSMHTLKVIIPLQRKTGACIPMLVLVDLQAPAAPPANACMPHASPPQDLAHSSSRLIHKPTSPSITTPFSIWMIGYGTSTFQPLLLLLPPPLGSGLGVGLGLIPLPPLLLLPLPKMLFVMGMKPSTVMHAAMTSTNMRARVACTARAARQRRGHRQEQQV
jgi:hypothetical protein